jgi:hypothetical protein
MPPDHSAPPVGVAQRAERLVVVPVRRSDVCDHHGLGVSSQAVLQHARQLRVPAGTQGQRSRPHNNIRVLCRSTRRAPHLYGTCPLLPSTSALMTLPSAVRDRLILMPSFSRSPACTAVTGRPRRCACDDASSLRHLSLPETNAVPHTCGARLTLPLAARQVHQVELAHSNVAGRGCRCTRAATHTTPHRTRAPCQCACALGEAAAHALAASPAPGAGHPPAAASAELKRSVASMVMVKMECERELS